jgi:hypothetical protein
MKRDIEGEARLETEARRLAHSGEYFDCISIRAVFTSAYPQAQKYFENLWVQQELNRLCENARRKVMAFS